MARKLRVETRLINSLGTVAKAGAFASCRGWPVCTDFFFSLGAGTLAVAHGAVPCDTPDEGEPGRDLDDPDAPPLLR